MRRTPESTPCQGRREFTSDDRAVLERVAVVCVHCPIRVSCREGAESRGERFGVWGGKVFGWHNRPGRPLHAVCAAGLHDLTVDGAVRGGPHGSQCRACSNAASERAKKVPTRCECGATVRRGFLTQHRRTAKHARQMEAAA